MQSIEDCQLFRSLLFPPAAVAGLYVAAGEAAVLTQRPLSTQRH